MTKRDLQKHFAKLGARGGHATAARMTPKQRARAARKAAKARWAKATPKKAGKARGRRPAAAA